MNLNFENKTALVGGSTQGIGKETAISLASLGCNVILLARNEEELIKLSKTLPVSKSQHHNYICADFTEPQKLKEKVENYISQKGPVNILINNTGGPAAGPIHSAKTEEFLSAFNQHLICNHILAQACIPGMKQSNYGRIINVISTSVKQPLHNLGVSNTIRAAVANWSKTLANELGKWNITVNNVLPGATSTQRLKSIIENKASKVGVKTSEVEDEMIKEIPLGRFAEPQEIANAIAFLASPAASYISGINLPVDGGRTGCL